MEQHLTYETALNELRQLEQDLEGDTITVDVLAEKVKRASELIAFCKTKLRAAETEVNQILEGMDE